MPRIPSYRLHKSSGQAVVRLAGKDRYIGQHGSPESKATYQRLIAQWKALGDAAFLAGPHGLSVNEVLLAYLKQHEDYYRKNGAPTGELELVGYALRVVKQLYGHEPANDFGPQALMICREAMIGNGWARKTINNHVARIKRVFKWATAFELVEPKVYQGLQAVTGLKRGRSQAKETAPVRPVDEAHVEATLPALPRPVAAMVRLQLLTGMRSGEVTAMRVRDLDRRGALWIYRPESHKTEHHGHERLVPLGERCQAILRPFLKADPDAYLFSPRDAEAERNAQRRAQRRSPMTPSQAKRRRKRKPQRAPAERYTPRSYRRCIMRACDKLGVPHWHPHQLRHTAGTNVRKQFGLDAAQAVLGHATARTTEIYAERNFEAAAKAMAAMG